LEQRLGRNVADGLGGQDGSPTEGLVEVKMSSPPPISPTPRLSADPSADAVAGDPVRLNVAQARGAQRTGAIWILVISLALAIVALGAYWLTQAPKLQAVNHPSGRDLNTQDVRKLYPTGATTAQPPSTPPH